MASCQQIDLWMSCKDPKSVMFPSKGLNTSALRHIPSPNGLVLAVADDEVLSGVEHNTGYVVGVSAQRVYFPGLALCRW